MNIKFRAWDREQEKMFNVVGITYEDNETLVWRKPYEGEYVNWSSAGLEIEKECELLFYTGINDTKSNKEIYKNDIVKIDFVLIGEPTEHFVGKVKMLEGCWVVDNGSNAYPLWSETNELEVIGNIYEDTYLLEEL